MRITNFPLAACILLACAACSSQAAPPDSPPLGTSRQALACEGTSCDDNGIGGANTGDGVDEVTVHGDKTAGDVDKASHGGDGTISDTNIDHGDPGHGVGANAAGGQRPTCIAGQICPDNSVTLKYCLAATSDRSEWLGFCNSLIPLYGVADSIACKAQYLLPAAIKQRWCIGNFGD